MNNKTVDVIERLQRLRKIMTEEMNLEKQVCRMTSKRAINSNNTNKTIKRLSPPIPQEEVKLVKKSNRQSVSKSKNETKRLYPQKTAPIRKKKSPDLRKSSIQKLTSKENVIQTLTEYRGTRSRSQTRSKRSSQARTQSPTSHRKMRNVEVQTGMDISSKDFNRQKHSYSNESEKRISAVHQDRLKRHFFGIWLRQRLRAERQRMDDSLNRRTGSTMRKDQYYEDNRQRTKRDTSYNRYHHKNEDIYEYGTNENTNYNPRAAVKRKELIKRSDKFQNSSTRRKKSTSSSLRNKGYQTQYIIETDKCKTKVKREPANVLESEITRILEAKKQHLRVPSPIYSKTTITKTTRRTKRKPSRTSSHAPEKRSKATSTSHTTHAKRHYDDIAIEEEEEYDEAEADKYIQKIRQQKLLEKFEEQRKKQMKTNINSHYGYIPKTDLDLFNDDDKILTRPTIPRRNQYNQIIDQIEEQQKHQIQMNYFNNDSNSVTSSNSSESLSNIQKVQGQNTKSEDVSSDILNMSFSEDKHATDINSFDVNDLGIKKNRNKKQISDFLPHSSDEDINLVPPEALIPKKPVVSDQKVAKVDPANQKDKEKQEIQERLDKMKLENYLFSSDDEDGDAKDKTTTEEQKQITKTTISQTQIVKNETKKIEKEETLVKKQHETILNDMHNSNDLLSSDQIEKIVNDEFSSEIANGMNRFTSPQSSFLNSTGKTSQVVVKPNTQKQYLYVKTTTTTINYDNEFEEEEEDFDINKFLSDEYREIPKTDNNKENADRIDYSDIERTKELAKKIESNISEDLSFGFEEVISKMDEKKQINDDKQSNEILQIEEEEEENEQDEVENQSVSKNNDDDDSEKIIMSDIDSLIEDKKRSDSNLKETNEIEENKENSNLKETDEIDQILNKSSDAIADLINDHSSDFEITKHEEASKDNKTNTNSSLDVDEFLDDFNENTNQKEEKEEIEDIVISNDSDTNKASFPFKVDFEIGVDELSSDNLDEKQQLDYKPLPPKTLEEALENSDKPELFLSKTETETENKSTEVKTKQKSQSEDDFIDDIDIDLANDESDKNNENEKANTKNNEESHSDVDIDVDDFNESSQKEDDKEKEKTSDVDIDVDDFNESSQKEDDKEKEKTASDIDIDVDDFNESSQKEDDKEKVKTASDIDIDVDDFNDDDETEKKQEDGNNKTNSSLDIDAFVEDSNDDDEPEKKQVEATKENDTTNTNSGLDADEFLDDFNEDDEATKKQAESSKENENTTNTNSGLDVEEFLDDFNEDEENQNTNKKEEKDSDNSIEDIVISSDSENGKSGFPFKVDFEIGVDELSSDNLEEKQTLDITPLPPKTLEEALEISNESPVKEEQIDDEDIKDISVTMSEHEPEKLESSNIDIEIDDFQMSDEEENKKKNDSPDENIDDISIPSEKEEEPKKSGSDDFNIDDISIPSEKEEEPTKNDSADENINDISIPSEKEEPKKSESDDFNIDDITLSSDNDEKTNNTTNNNKNNNKNTNNEAKNIINNNNLNDQNGFPFKVDYVANVNDLSSSGIEERPKLDISSLQKQGQKTTVETFEVSIEGNFEIEIEDNVQSNSYNKQMTSNSNNVTANNSQRLNQGIDNIADDFYIESDNDIDINDFQDDSDKGEADNKSNHSDNINVDLDEGVLSDKGDEKPPEKEEDIDLGSDFDIEIDLDD